VKIIPYAASIVALAGVVLVSQPVFAQSSAAPGAPTAAPQPAQGGTLTNSGTVNASGGALNGGINNKGAPAKSGAEPYTQSGGTTTNAGTMNTTGAIGTSNQATGTITNNGTINDKAISGGGAGAGKPNVQDRK